MHLRRFFAHAPSERFNGRKCLLRELQHGSSLDGCSTLQARPSDHHIQRESRQRSAPFQRSHATGRRRGVGRYRPQKAMASLGDARSKLTHAPQSDRERRRVQRSSFSFRETARRPFWGGSGFLENAAFGRGGVSSVGCRGAPRGAGRQRQSWGGAPREALPKGNLRWPKTP
jgi:hypothetical protein